MYFIKNEGEYDVCYPDTQFNLFRPLFNLVIFDEMIKLNLTNYAIGDILYYR